MYAITGITGRVGGELARSLRAANQPVRAVVRDKAKGAAWAAQGCEVAVAEMQDVESLTRAFTGAEAVFILLPPVFDPAPGYPEVQRMIDAVIPALKGARPQRVVSLSTIGADATQDNLLSQHTLMEAALGKTGLPVTLLRPGWFMENAQWDVAAARDTGILHSFLQPVGTAFPMVATRDVGRLAAALIQETWSGTRVVELEGPQRVSPQDIARTFADVLGCPVRTEIVPRQSWEALFLSQGMQHPQPRIRMLDGFNEGWIEFRDGGRHAIRGQTPLAEVIAGLVADAAQAAP